MNIIEQLIEKYGLAPDSYYTESPYTNRNLDEASRLREQIFLVKEDILSQMFESRVVDGYYGISLRVPTPEVWLDVIKDFLEYVEKTDSDFGIYQVKVKLGSLRCYLSNVSEETQGYIRQLETLLSDKFLIY